MLSKLCIKKLNSASYLIAFVEFAGEINPYGFLIY